MELQVNLSEQMIFLISAGIIIFFNIVILLLVIFKINKNKFSEDFQIAQSELSGRISQLSEFNVLQGEKISGALEDQKLAVQKLVDEKLLAITKSVGDGLEKSNAMTAKTLTDLCERLTKIDAAQQKISSLSEQVVSLQEVLSNKQARGAFGEIQLNDLVVSTLPPSAYNFQVVLSNGKRADCVLNLPNPPGTIVIDSKFPLESYQALREAQTERDKIEAERFFRASVLKHIRDIAEKYIITGETAESALMFLPSESIYAELHAHFTDVVEASYRAKVWIVSPTTLMATLNTIRAILKDAKMREQAGIIQKEVGCLIDDINRLDDRIENLARHFEQANKDIGDIRVSSGKISKRIEKIEDLQLEDNSETVKLGQPA